MPANVMDMAYTGEAPWWGGGTYVNRPMTVEEAVSLTGMDYQVQKVELQWNGLPTGIFATMRVDTSKIIAPVNKDYVVVQNLEALRFLDDVIDKKDRYIETAGVIGMGEKIWVLLRLPETFYVVPKDLIKTYIVVMTGHDAETAITYKQVNVRVVCQNTFKAAYDEDSFFEEKIPHVAHAKVKIAVAHRMIGLASKNNALYAQILQNFASKRFNDQQREEFIVNCFPAGNKGLTGAQSERRDRLNSYIDADVNNPPGAEGTLYTLHNASTGFADHHFPAKDTAKSILIGKSNDLKVRAWTWLYKRLKHE